MLYFINLYFTLSNISIIYNLYKVKEGGIISWGITPTLSEEFELENVKTMIDKLEEMWGYLQKSGLSREQILSQCWLAPARCCLINQDGGATVEHSFELLKEL